MNNLALQEPWLNDTAADEAAELEAHEEKVAERAKEIAQDIIGDGYQEGSSFWNIDDVTESLYSSIDDTDSYNLIMPAVLSDDPDKAEAGRIFLRQLFLRHAEQIALQIAERELE